MVTKRQLLPGCAFTIFDDIKLLFQLAKLSYVYEKCVVVQGVPKKPTVGKAYSF